MEAASRMDYLIGRLENLNTLLSPDADFGSEEGDPKEEEPPGRGGQVGKSGKSGRGKSGKAGGQSGIADMFTRAAREMFRRIHNAYAAVLGLSDPSDGRPQQEHCPDWAWFRPISFNRQAWIDAWPELQV